MRFSSILAVAAPLLVHAAPLSVKRNADPTSIAVLKFAQVLEQLETEFYTQALAKFVAQDFTDAGISVPDVAIKSFQDIQSHESAHVKTLNDALEANGASPITSCTFDFTGVLSDVATMASVARVVELVGVGAYLGGAELIGEKNVLDAAASILTTEARHQTFLNILAGATSIPQAQDVALTPSDVLAVAGAFVKGCDVATELGLPPANPALGVQNTGVITGGTQLQFSSPALNSTVQTSTLSCQMMIGGEATSRSLPFDQCIVPTDINGPVWIWITNDPQPLAAGIHNRATVNIVAGPTAAFIDSISDPLGALVRTNGSGFNSSETLSPSQAQDQLISATATESPTTLFATDAPSPTAAPTEANAVITAAPTLVTASAVPPIQVIGVGSIPASSA